MPEYRTGNHWGVTIVREGVDLCPAGMSGACVSMREGFARCKIGECVHHESGRSVDAELVAVVTNGDRVLAQRICDLLNGDRPTSVLDDWSAVSDDGLKAAPGSTEPAEPADPRGTGSPGPTQSG